MMSKFVLTTEPRPGVRVIALSRPEKKNALTRDMYDAASAALKAADADQTVRVVCLTGSGDAFTAGNDIADFQSGPPPVSDQVGPGGFIASVAAMKKPVIAAVNGLAVGIGTTILLHCDLVYAAAGAKFQLPFVNLGLVPEAGSTLILPGILGRHRAAQLFFFGEAFDAATAERWGLVNTVFPNGELMDRTLERAETLAAKPARVVRLIKRLLTTPATSIRERADEELGLLAAQLDGDEAREAMQAFLERRRPDFSRFR
jgi:enoyl-CoA hydratase/carnithine racemase